ncbi:hypothetical protein [Succinivibrio dextrinosolvens]|uniref:hypothetical protein n=1 Tax=Succinivibrio dextrinosolvens TaxID=83771 RepID=UPI0019249918|nr:hypothetical protein [Succinivibrio dextrinosolvens]
MNIIKACWLFIKSYFSKLYAVYFIRWQISTVVMMPFMYVLDSLGLSVIPNLIIAQTIGSLIFFRLDKLIFNFFDRIKNRKHSKDSE